MKQAARCGYGNVCAKCQVNGGRVIITGRVHGDKGHKHSMKSKEGRVLVGLVFYFSLRTLNYAIILLHTPHTTTWKLKSDSIQKAFFLRYRE